MLPAAECCVGFARLIKWEALVDDWNDRLLVDALVHVLEHVATAHVDPLYGQAFERSFPLHRSAICTGYQRCAITRADKMLGRCRGTVFVGPLGDAS